MHSKKYGWVSLLCIAGLWACSTDNMGSGNTGGGGATDRPDTDPNTTLEKTFENQFEWGLDDPDVIANGVGLDKHGNLVLDQKPGPKNPNVFRHMWLPDRTNGMVSKFDMETAREVARYRSFFPFSCKEGELPELNNCSVELSVEPSLNIYGERVYNQPLQTAIDADGNLWVMNAGRRNPVEVKPSVTKIAGDERFCVKRKGGAKLNTSTDLDGSGAIEPREVLDVGEDDCVLFTTQLEDSESRCSSYALSLVSLSIDAAGDAWVTCGSSLYQLDSKNGQVKRGPIRLPLEPSVSVIDGRQNLWLLHSVSGTYSPGNFSLQGVDTRTGEMLSKTPVWRPESMAIGERCNSRYSFAVDFEDRLWLSGCVYNPYAEKPENAWHFCDLGGDGLEPVIGENGNRGVVVGSNNQLYSLDHANTKTDGHWVLTRFQWDDETNSCKLNPIGLGERIRVDLYVAMGLALDATEKYFWGTGHQNTFPHKTFRVNLETGELSTIEPAEGHFPSYWALDTKLSFASYQSLNQGTYRRVIEGCSPQTFWKKLAWEAEVPEGTRLRVYVRFADTREGLASAQRHLVGDSQAGQTQADLSNMETSAWMQVEFVLESPSGQGSPLLRNYSLERACEWIFQ